MIENDMVITKLIGDYLRENNIKGEKKLPTFNVGEVFEIDKETNEMIYYGEANDILNSKEFKQWYERKEKQNEQDMEL